jgi:hypothetical protein
MPLLYDTFGSSSWLYNSIGSYNLVGSTSFTTCNVPVEGPLAINFDTFYLMIDIYQRQRDILGSITPFLFRVIQVFGKIDPCCV